MRECPFCGNEIPDRSCVCIYCGGRLGGADDAGAEAKKHRQIVFTTAAVGVFVVLVIVFSLLATVISNGENEGGNNFVPGGYVFSSHTTSATQIEGDGESSVIAGSESSRSSSSSGRRKASSGSSKPQNASSSGNPAGSSEAASPGTPDSSYSSEPDAGSSSHEEPPESSSAEPPDSSSEPTPESSDSGFVPPED